LASSTGSVAASLISGIVISVISHALWKFSDLGSKRRSDELIPAGGALAGIVIGTAIRMLQAGLNPLMWTAAAAGIVTSAAVTWLRSGGHSETCFVHRTRLTAVLQCPRCRQKFCGKSDCWEARGFRCQRCHQNDVLLMNLRDEQWWTKRFRNRVSSGNCMKCLTASANADVHECGQCHWQMCRRCWDLDNFQCRKCGWIPAGLPEALTVLLPPPRTVPPRGPKRIVADPSHQQR
jgi:hypothetical protein